MTCMLSLLLLYEKLCVGFTLDLLSAINGGGYELFHEVVNDKIPTESSKRRYVGSLRYFHSSLGNFCGDTDTFMGL